MTQNLYIPKILALDTSLNACSVAIQVDDKIIMHHEIAPQKQSELILPMIEAILSEVGVELAQLDAIALGSGPGSFTGIRLATSIVQGLCLGAKLKAIPISTLQIMAQTLYRKHKIENALIGIDARMKQIYWSAYTCKSTGNKLTGRQKIVNKIMQPIIADCLCTPDNPKIEAQMQDLIWTGVGSAWQAYGDVLKNVCNSKSLQLGSELYLNLMPEAQDLLDLAIHAYNLNQTVSTKQLLPAYLQNELYK